MCYYMSVCIITFLTSFLTATRIYLWMFLGWTPTKFLSIRVLPLFVMVNMMEDRYNL